MFDSKVTVTGLVVSSFFSAAIVYAWCGLTTALHCMQNGAVALSIASGSTWLILMVLRLPQASLPASSSWTTWIVPVSLCATKLYSSASPSGTPDLSSKWHFECIDATSVSSKSDSADTSSCSCPFSCKSWFNLVALLASGSKWPSKTMARTFATFACSNSWESLLYVVADLVDGSIWCPSIVRSSRVRISVMPHHVSTVGLQECELYFAASASPSTVSKNSFKNKDASAVVIGETAHVPLLSFHEGRNARPVFLLISLRACTKHSPHTSSHAERPSAVNGNSLVFASLLLDVLCLDVSASTKTRSPQRSVQMFSNLEKSDHRAEAKTQKSKAPATAVLKRLVLLMQMISSALTAATVNCGACFNFLFSKYIECAAPKTLDERSVLHAIFLNLSALSKKFKDSTRWLALVGAACCSLKKHI